MTAPHVTVNLTQLGYRRTDAAKLIGVSPTKFDSMVKAGDMPEPFRFDGIVIWRSDDLIMAFNKLTNQPTSDEGGQPKPKPWPKKTR